MDGLWAVRGSKVDIPSQEFPNTSLRTNGIVGYRSTRIFRLEICEPLLINRIGKSRSGSTELDRRPRNSGGRRYSGLNRRLGEALRDSPRNIVRYIFRGRSWSRKVGPYRYAPSVLQFD